MNEKEKRIKDQRIIEATKKGFMGLGGKFGLILRNLGQPIIAQGFGYDRNYLDDAWETPADNDDGPKTPEEYQKKIPYFHFDASEEPVGTGWREEREMESTPYSVQELGFVFDGLSRGMHLEIKYMVDSNEISVYHGGYLVYQEVAGDLMSYAPKEDWENLIDSLYKISSKKEKEKNKESKKERKIEAEEVKERWWQNIKRKWGL